MMWRVIAALFLVGAACTSDRLDPNDGTSLPLPDMQKISYAYDAAHEQFLVLGLAGAVPPSTRVILRNLSTEQSGSDAAANNGSFVVGIAASPDDVVGIRYEDDDQVSGEALLPLAAPVNAPPAPLASAQWVGDHAQLSGCFFEGGPDPVIAHVIHDEKGWFGSQTAELDSGDMCFAFTFADALPQEVLWVGGAYVESAHVLGPFTRVEVDP